MAGDSWRRDLERRVAALEERLAKLSGPPDPMDPVGLNDPDDPDDLSDPADPFALLSAFDAVAPAGGAAVVGAVPRGGGVVRWQYALPDAALSALDWSAHAATLAALGSPVRLQLLQLIDSGVAGSAELAARDDLGTTGQVHHHLRALVAAGWLESSARGHYRIPPARLVPLLAVLVAARR